MRKLQTIEAYLDKFNEIIVYLSKTYYNGESRYFSLKTEHETTPLTIIEVTIDEEYQCYRLSAPDLIIGGEYTLVDERNLRTSLQFGYIVRTTEFDQLFNYEGDDLGATYDQHETTFKVWAPIANQVKIEIQQPHSLTTYDLIRYSHGVWSITIPGNLELASYIYLVKVNGQWNQATDPYALASTPNHKRSVVINPQKVALPLHKEKLAPLASYTDAIIYEMHVRDFSIHQNSGIKHVGKFLGVCEPGTRTNRQTLTGLDYLEDLGVTHLQFLPIYDFGSVDELNQFEHYNWGYDPVQYNVPEGSYATNVLDPYSRIIDLKKMIAKLHERGFRVIMDVVYNHMFDRQITAFEKIVPNYYFRLGPNGEISNGSFCGNDMDTLRPMYRKFVIDSTKMWVRDYGVDGFRFDLMGILDTETMNLITKECQSIDSSVMVYGEGWNMPTLMEDHLKATMDNHHKMPNIGHFNDQFGRSVKGSPFETELEDIGYGLGDLTKIKPMMDAIIGSPFSEPTMSLNYAECHDNMTLFDKIMASNPQESLAIRLKRQRLITGLILVSQGIPFLHAGQEFNRTKGGDHNSYRSPDSTNALDWDLKDQYQDSVNYVKDFIELRKEIKTLRLDTAAQIKEHINLTTRDNRVIEYTLTDANSSFEEIKIFINASLEPLSLNLEGQYQLLANGEGRCKSSKTLEHITVDAIELIVLGK